MPQMVLTGTQPVGELTPLEYMLRVINDPSAAQTRRDRLAVAAAPYLHPRPMPVRVSKKATAAKAAEMAGKGSDWGDDLTPDGRPQ
jgi:phage terminase small subunit